MRLDFCRPCDGTGYSPQKSQESCTECGGTGRTPWKYRVSPQHDWEDMGVLESGKRSYLCRTCKVEVQSLYGPAPGECSQVISPDLDRYRLWFADLLQLRVCHEDGEGKLFPAAVEKFINITLRLNDSDITCLSRLPVLVAEAMEQNRKEIEQLAKSIPNIGKKLVRTETLDGDAVGYAVAGLTISSEEAKKHSISHNLETDAVYWQKRDFIQKAAVAYAGSGLTPELAVSRAHELYQATMRSLDPDGQQSPEA